MLMIEDFPGGLHGLTGKPWLQWLKMDSSLGSRNSRAGSTSSKAFPGPQLLPGGLSEVTWLFWSLSEVPDAPGELSPCWL